MENISKISQLNPYDTAIDESISLYLSFNSSMADKTIEAEENLFDREEDRENQGTVIKKNIEMTPMRKAPKSILQEINVFSSTPTCKVDVEQIQEGISALGLAPLEEVVQEKLAVSEKKDLSTIRENTLEIGNYKQKNSELCDGDETIDGKSQNVVTLSSSSSDCSNLISIIVIDTDSDNSLEKIIKGARAECPSTEVDATSLNHISNYNMGTISESKEIINKNYIDIVVSTDVNLNEENKENIFKEKQLMKSDSTKSGVGTIPKVKKFAQDSDAAKKGIPAEKLLPTMRSRKSLLPCEPDLNLNRPSRIESSKRLSTYNLKRSPTKFTSNIPMLLKAVGDYPRVTIGSNVFQEKDETKRNRKSLIPPPTKPKLQDAGKRQTIFSAQSNKRLSVAKQKMSTVPEPSPKKLPKMSGILKTTLNRSASRRSTRKSLNPVGVSSSKLRSSIIPPPAIILNCIKARSKSPIQMDKETTSQLKKPQQRTPAAPSSRTVFSCDKCPRIFRLSSSLEAHKALHSVKACTALVCKYCDKRFAIAKALTIHLLEHCSKIPTFERKKLLYPPKTNNDKSLKNNNAQSEITKHNTHAASHSMTSISSPSKTKEVLRPGSSAKGKCRIPPAHSGVYRTPSKPVVCYPCKKNFDHVLSFTEHVMSYHSSGDDS